MTWLGGFSNILSFFFFFQSADLTNANLEGANLEGANLKVQASFWLYCRMLMLRVPFSTMQLCASKSLGRTSLPLIVLNFFMIFFHHFSYVNQLLYGLPL